MPDYSNSSIYKIVCKEEFVTECYVGSTFNLCKRIGQHKTTCNNVNDKDHNLALYKFIRDHGGWENWFVVEVERVSCENVKQLCVRERHWLEHYGETLNLRTPSRTKSQYYQEHRDKELARSKAWAEKNREHLREKSRAYREKNHDEKLERDRAYHHKNKEAINAKNREKITCGCGKVFSHCNKARHERSGKHKEWLEQQEALGEN
jgi:hypothetical protein